MSAAKVTQHTDLGDVMDMLGQHRRYETHDRHRLTPMGGPELEHRLRTESVDSIGKIVLRPVQPGKLSADVARYVGVVEVWLRPVESELAAWAVAAAAWRALKMPYEEARCQFGEARALLGARIDRDRAAELLAEAGDTAVRLGAEPLRAQIEALARRARIDAGNIDVDTATHGLTRREREVLGLMASGATNRGIADALFISVKTAGVHVSNILRKLEVTNRAEATSVAFRDDLVS